MRERVSNGLAYTALATVLLLVLAAVSRPIATDDAWWHLALGRTFARVGPWPSDDPLLFSAVRPPNRSSWLADVALAELLERAGFAGLRAAHVAFAAAILALAGALLRRGAASRQVASLALIGFATLAAYRLFQLRPDLVTLFATLLLYAFVLRPRAGPAPRRIALCAIGMALWANLHAGFLLGPILIAAALAGVIGAVLGAGPSPAERLRIRRLLACLTVGALATLANPSGIAAHLAYFGSGEQSPILSWVGDEWTRVDLFTWPTFNRPPTRAEWLWVWGLLLGTIASSVAVLVDARSERRAAPPGQRSTAIDPALVALAWAALAAMLLAVRFLWLAFFPLLLISRTWAERSSAARVPAWTGWLRALLGPALLAGFVWIGPWPRISDVLDLSFAQWAEPYAAEKYPVEAIWLMRDAGLAGRLFTEYSLGGYAGFWLAPKIETFVNGSLNFAPDTASEYIAIRKRLPAAPGESFPELLDRLELDLFLGTGTPAGPHGPSYTVAHLERTPGWIAIFRNATSALYLRVGAPDSANLRQVADYYAREGIPFDPERGFEPARVIRDHEPWAVEHRVIPRTFAAIERAAIQPGAPLARPRALVQTASFYALLGACDLALEREALIRSIDALAVGSRRRTVWCLLRAGRYEDARAQAAALDGLAGADELARITVELARAIPTLSADVRESMVRRLPLLSPAQAQALAFSLETPPARVR